jgi:nucleoid-associated protein YgaU
MDLYFSKGAAVRFRFPVTPQAVTVTTPGRDRAATLIDGSEIGLLNGAGLREVRFEALLPNKRYGFAVYPGGVFRRASHFLSLLARLKKERGPFLFTLSGKSGGHSLSVTLESYTIHEDASLGGDVNVSVRLREARTASLSVIQPKKGKSPPPRSAPSTPAPKTYTVVRGDTLWAIARKFLGNGARWPEIHALNRDRINNPNLIYPGQKLRLP